MNAQELPVGSSIAGNLDYESEIWYSIRPAQTAFLVVETTGDTDTYIEIYDAQNNLIMEDDDGGEKTNARVDIYVKSGSTYYVKVRSYNNRISGQYYIHARFIQTPTFIELSFGTPYTGRISTGEDYWFSIKPAMNGMIVVETTGNTDTYLDAYNNLYAHLKSDDDSGEGKNARMEISVNSNQNYFFKLRAYSRNASGSYRIQAYFYQQTVSGQPNVPAFDGYVPPAEPLPADIEMNDERSRAVSMESGAKEEVSVIFYGKRNEGRWYSFELTDDANVVIYTTGNLNSYLYLYDSLGNQIARDNDSGEGYNALISKALETGTYFIEVMEFFNRPGRCTLYVENQEIILDSPPEDKKSSKDEEE